MSDFLPTENECKNAQNPGLWMRMNYLAHRVLDDWPTVPLIFGAGAVVGLVRYVSLREKKEIDR